MDIDIITLNGKALRQIMNSQDTKSEILASGVPKRILITIVASALALFLLFLFYPFPEEGEIESEETSQDTEETEGSKEESSDTVDRSLSSSLEMTDSRRVTQTDDSVVFKLPSLEESDEYIRGAVVGWGLPGSWLKNDYLISRVSTLLTSASLGELPRRQLIFLAPKVGFKVFQDGKKIYVNPENYRRFDSLVESIESIPVGKLARLIRDLDPLLRFSLRKLGIPQSPESVLLQALDRVIGVPEVPPKVELVRSVVVFKFADPDLERLTELEKQLVRMGPSNLEKLRSFARKLRVLYLKT